jgi:sugar lactone lactonase YvrE
MTPRAASSVLSAAVFLAALLLTSPRASNAQNVNTYATGVTGAKDLAWKPDGSGVLFVSGQSAGVGLIYQVGPGGSPVTTFATGFTDPWGLAFGPSGDLYVADRGVATVANSGRIWKVASDGSKTVWVSGLGDPMFIAFDAAGDLFVGEWGPRNLKRVSPAGVVTLYAAGAVPLGENLGGLVIEPTGEIYIGSETYIRVVGPGGSPVTVFASGLVSTVGLVRSPDGGFFSGQYSHHDVWKVTAGGVASDWAGGDISCVGGPRLSAGFHTPAGVSIHNSTLYIADAGCNAVRTIDEVVPTVHGTWGRVKSLYR